MRLAAPVGRGGRDWYLEKVEEKPEDVLRQALHSYGLAPMEASILCRSFQTCSVSPVTVCSPPRSGLAHPEWRRGWYAQFLEEFPGEVTLGQ